MIQDEGYEWKSVGENIEADLDWVIIIVIIIILGAIFSCLRWIKSHDDRTYADLSSIWQIIAAIWSGFFNITRYVEILQSALYVKLLQVKKVCDIFLCWWISCWIWNSCILIDDCRILGPIDISHLTESIYPNDKGRYYGDYEKGIDSSMKEYILAPSFNGIEKGSWTHVIPLYTE